MPKNRTKPKSKYSSIKKLKEITAKTNELCIEDDENETKQVKRFLGDPTSHELIARLTTASSAVCGSRKSAASLSLSESIRKEISDEDIVDLSEIFNIFDIQNRGEISFQDLLRSMRFLRFSPDEKKLKELLATSHHSDMDNFGLEIFIYCVVECQNRRTDWTQQIIDVFHRIDVGNKGAINLEDLKYANKMKDLELCEKEMNEMIMAADLNKDGMVDKQEFVSIMLQTNLFR